MTSKVFPVFAVLTSLPHAGAAAEQVRSEIAGNINRPAQLDATPERISRLKLAEGFRLSVFARDLGEPRMMAVSPDGRLLVTRRGEKGDVLVLEDRDGNGEADSTRTLVGLPHVHGIAIHDRTLYLATVRELYSARLPAGDDALELKVLYDDLPDAGQHPNRTLAFNPEGKLFLSVGSTCNAAPEPNKENATLLEVSTDGSGRRIHASGLRNTIGFGWHPDTAKLYGMDHGIDWLGDDSQREELNELKQGAKYGWPFVFEDGKPNPADDPMKTEGMTWTEYAGTCEAPVLTATAHSAPMALLFPSSKQFPGDFSGDALVSFHGSWNRGEPSGYSVMRLRFEDGKPSRFEPFLDGFLLPGEKAQFGRPCGLIEWTDGSVLLSDDGAGMIYRIAAASGKD